MNKKDTITAAELKKLWKEDKTIKEIAKHFNCHPTTISKRARKWRLSKKKKGFKIEKYELHDLYIVKNKTRKYCAEYFGCSERTITEIAKRYGISKSHTLVTENLKKFHRD
ncbi:MAG: helix-turn-helix domain-containing protein [Methanobrevibacter sp.]|jgi:transposase-like protein|nr:helix-turn-helix domain-containing protein [Candidatus Methanovirga aequatorialis]